MIRRKILYDTKVLISASASLAFSIGAGAFLSGLKVGSPLVDLLIAGIVLGEIYGVFGTFLAGCSVASRHSKKFHKFWAGDY